MAVALLRHQDATERDVLLAWQFAALQRQQKLPSPKSLLLKTHAGQQQSVEQHRAALQMLSAQYGIPLRKQGERIPMTKPRRIRGR